MKNQNQLLLPCLSVLMLSFAQPAAAITVNFNIAGVDGGGTLSVNFSGEDRGIGAIDPPAALLADGLLSHVQFGNTELDSFSVTLTGGAALGDLVFNFSGLTGFQYDIPGAGESLLSGLLGLSAFGFDVAGRVLELRIVDGVHNDGNFIEIAEVGGDVLVAVPVQ